MVWPAIRAGLALGAPEHFFGGDCFPALEGFVSALVESLFAGLNHHTGEFVPQDAGEPSQTWIEDIAVFVGLGHVHIRTADAASLDFNQYFVFPRGRDIEFPDFQAGVAPNQTAQIGLTTFNIFCSKLETRFGVPIRNEGNAFHLSVHIHSPIRIS